MLHYENKIERALDYLKSPSKLSPTGYSPIVYMVYQPEDAFVVRGLIDSFLKPKAEYMGFHAHEFSMGLVIDRFINTNDYLDIWIDPDVEEPELYNSIKQAIVNDRYIEKALLEKQDQLLTEEENYPGCGDASSFLYDWRCREQYLQPDSDSNVGALSGRNARHCPFFPRHL